jgi:hypothetical protein
MARRVGASQTTINRIIHHDLNSKKKMKAKVYHLDDKWMIFQRKEQALKFYDLIANGKYKDVLTTDEAMLPLNFKNGQRKLFYQSKNPGKRRSEKSEEPPSFPKQQMFAASYGWFGQTRLYVIPSKAKINAETLF